MQTQPPSPPQKWPSRRKKCAMCKKNDERKILHHIAFGVAAVQNGHLGRPKIKLSSEWSNLQDLTNLIKNWFWIDLALIFCMNDFSCVVFNFWDMSAPISPWAPKRYMMWYEILRRSLLLGHWASFMSRWPLLYNPIYVGAEEFD